MANIDVTTNKQSAQLSNNESGRGWTHAVTIDWEDFVANPSASDNDTLTFAIADIPAYSVVESVAVRLVTAFDDSGGGSSLTAIVGDTDDDNGFVTAQQLHVDGTEVFLTANTGAYFTGTDSGAATTANVIKGKTYTTANTLEAVFTPSSFKLDECTQGKVVVLARIMDTNVAIQG